MHTAISSSRYISGARLKLCSNPLLHADPLSQWKYIIVFLLTDGRKGCLHFIGEDGFNNILCFQLMIGPCCVIEQFY